MSGVRAAETAIRLVQAAPARPQFVCHSCRRLVQRQFHTSPVAWDERPWHQRLLQNVFGGRKKQDEAKAREERTAKKAEKLAEEGGGRAVQVLSGGKVYEVAPLVDRALDPQYQKASDWTGLEVVGGDAWAKQQQDKGKPYVGFARATGWKDLSPEQWQCLVVLTAYEAEALRKAGRSLSELCEPRSDDLLDVLLNGGIRLSKSGVVLDDAARDAVLDIVSTTGTTWNARGSSSDVAFEIPNDLESLSLSQSDLKLAITKRINQLTGKRIADAKLTQITTLSQLTELLSVKPTPKKLSQHPALQQTIKEIPNVKIVSRKTPAVEKQVGRWKLIVAELEKRDLPVHGTRYPAGRRYLPGIETPPPAGVNPPREKRAVV